MKIAIALTMTLVTYGCVSINEYKVEPNVMNAFADCVYTCGKIGFESCVVRYTDWIGSHSDSIFTATRESDMEKNSQKYVAIFERLRDNCNNNKVSP